MSAGINKAAASTNTTSDNVNAIRGIQLLPSAKLDGKMLVQTVLEVSSDKGFVRKVERSPSRSVGMGVCFAGMFQGMSRGVFRTATT